MSTPIPRQAAFLAVLVLALAGVSAVVVPPRACAPQPDYALEILVDGRPLTAYEARGRTYVEASDGREYAVRLTNRTGGRVAAALAVDGLNVIDARHTTAREARKWILEPYESVTLWGWQTGTRTARRFVFTGESASYGAWLGATADLGTVTAAFFRERRPVPEPVAPAWMKRGGGNTPRARQDAPCERSSSGGLNKTEAKDELAATGIGREIEHPVVEIPFDAEDAPAHVANLRYEYHDALVKLGVLPRDESDAALERRERARGFSRSGFAPDPYRAR